MALVEREDCGAVAHLTLNAPERLNALSDAMLAALQESFDALAGESAIRAITLGGRGKAFCAGHDLKEMTAGRSENDGGAAYFADLFGRCSRLMLTILELPQPVIARVHGIATAAGCQLVASCDMAVAGESCRFGVNGVNIGLFCSTPMVALSRNVARKQAFEMLVTGKFVEAARALELGLVNRVVPDDALEESCRELAETVAEKLGSAVRIGKRAFYEQIQMPLDAAYAHVGEVMVENMLDGDTAEGISAFIEKRRPEWARQ